MEKLSYFQKSNIIIRMQTLRSMALCVVFFLSGCSPFGGSEADSQFHPGTPVFVADLSLSDATLYDYGGVTIGSSSSKAFTLTNSGNSAAAAITPSSFSSEYLFLGGAFPGTGGTCTSSLASGGSCTLVLNFAPTSIGIKNDSLSLTYQSQPAMNPALTQTVSRSVTGTGLTIALLSISDGATYDYGNVAVTQTASKTFTLTNSGQSTATVVTGTPPSSPFSYPSGFPGGGSCGTTLAAGNTCTFIAAVSPTGYGSLSETLSVTYNNGLNPTSATRAVIGNAVGLAGTIDSSFGEEGRLSTSVGTASDNARALQLQTDERVIVAGYARNASGNDDFALVRYQTDGTLDTSFNTNGKVLTTIGSAGESAYALVLQTDGRALAAGYSRNASGNDDFSVARYLSNGRLDTSFKTTGKETTTIGTSTESAFAIALQSDGKSLAAGFALNAAGDFDFAVVRYESNGNLDTSFKTTGKTTTPIGTGADTAYALILQTNGKSIAGGFFTDTSGRIDFGLVRQGSDGNLDTSFKTTGKVITSIGTTANYLTALVLQTDGKAVAAGYAANDSGDYDFVVVRYQSDGLLDTSFSTRGIVATTIGPTSDYANAVILQTDGKIVASGYFINGSSKYNLAFARYQTNGLLDTSFNSTGTIATNWVTGLGAFVGDISYSLGLKTDGSVLSAGVNRNGGQHDFGFTRIWP